MGVASGVATGPTTDIDLHLQQTRAAPIVFMKQGTFELHQTIPATAHSVVRACFFVACISTALQTVCTADDYDLYLLAGQSNMDGRGLVSELPPEQQKPVDQAIVFYRSVPRTISPAYYLNNSTKKTDIYLSGPLFLAGTEMLRLYNKGSG